MPGKKRVVIFANGLISHVDEAHRFLLPDDTIIAADGGGRHCRQLGLTPDILIGDFDSLEPADLEAFVAAGARIVRHPARKDYTDLELALLLAQPAPVPLCAGLFGHAHRFVFRRGELARQTRLGQAAARVGGPRREVRMGGDTTRSRGFAVHGGGESGEAVPVA